MTSAVAAHQDTRADIHDAELRRRISPGALRTWFGIATQWALTDIQAARLLGTADAYVETKVSPITLVRVRVRVRAHPSQP